MPRTKRDAQERPRRVRPDLVNRLADELRQNREAAQPYIEEDGLSGGQMVVNVIWDAWDSLPTEARSDVIHQAYKEVEGPEYAEQLVVMRGLTVPDALEVGWLPLQVIPAVRKTDRVTLKQCHQAMIEDGASVLLDPENPQLRFTNRAGAEAAIKRLADRLPESADVWLIVQDVGRGNGWREA